MTQHQADLPIRSELVSSPRVRALTAVPREGDELTSGAPLAKRPRHFPTDAQAPFRSYDPNEIVLPQKVIACMEGGMLKYIPLTLLTNKACRDATRMAAMDKDLKHTLRLEDGNLRMTPASFDSMGEDAISLADWIDASARYVKLMSRHLLAGSDAYPGGPDSQRIAGEWDAHFRIIRERANFSECFHIYRVYDIWVRRIWQNQLTSQDRRDSAPVDFVLWPNTWHDDLYRQIMDDEFYKRICPDAPSILALPGGGSFSATSSAMRSSSRVISSNSNRTSSRLSAGEAPRRSLPGEQSVRCNARACPVVQSNAMIKTVGETRTVLPTASGSMVPLPAHIRTLVNTYTPVPCVSAEIMALNLVVYSELFPVVTRLRWTAWEAILAKHNLSSTFGDITISLQFGFLMGLERYFITNTFTPPNHYRTVEHHDFVLSKYAEEIDLGQISRGYPPDFLQQCIGHFRTAPLNVVQNTPGGKMRVTIDHSFPHSKLKISLGVSQRQDGALAPIPFDPASTSVNTVIDSKKFQCTWVSYDCKDDSPQFATIPSFPGTKDTPPNFAVDWNGHYRLGEKDIYFTDNWRYKEDRSLVEESHFYTDRGPSDLPRVAVKFNGEIYLYEREILYRPDAKVFTERGTGLVLTDDIWNIPKNVTKEDLLLHVPFDKKERLAHLIDQRNQQLSAERSKTQSPRNAPAPLRPSKPYSRPSPQEPVASGSSQIQRQRSRKTESPEKSRTSSRQQSPEPRRETSLPRRTPTPPGNPPDDPLTMAAAANNPSKFTFPAPEAFTGEKTRARSWITECETYFTQPVKSWFCGT
ncbi:hypothetical protein M378DRAFT_18694 [Amanita muscaria Koide BX008]|uniref:Uncharacterized protein n=1 Tax=Amanita muscaria (strain Koide BX008) TaxID=946122 RepID=A0A0C2W0L9_AMAMK|nr:hypothetical protein M378DRAFT_18694 [Amanita muscaria Koide BX008]